MNINKKRLGTPYSEKNKGYIMVFFAGALWGTIGIFVNLLSKVGVDSSFAAFMRLFTGSLILLPTIFSMGGLKMFKIDKVSLIHCLLLGVLTQALFNFCYNMSITNVGVATASILLYTAPVFTCILSRFFFREVIGRMKVIALILNIIGCFLMVTGGNLFTQNISLLGIFFGVASGFLYSLVTIIGKIASDKIHPFTVVFYSFMFGWITLGVIVRPWTYIDLFSELRFWIYSFGFGLIPTVGSYLLYMGGLSMKLEISRVPVIASVETIVATLIGVYLFKEKLGIINIFGIVFLLLSIMFINFKS